MFPLTHVTFLKDGRRIQLLHRLDQFLFVCPLDVFVKEIFLEFVES